MGKGKLPDYENPDQITTGIVEFDDEKCTRCGTCAKACGGASIIIPPKVEGEKRALPQLVEAAPDVTLCVACGDCLAACPNGAITIKRGFRVKPPYLFQKYVQQPEFTYPKKY